jgi:protocatechuate 3,4-dioxygenase beta subunit
MKTFKAVAWVFVLALGMLAGAKPACSQTAALNGTIFDPGGASVPGAQVTVVNEATGLTRSATTAEDGKYILAQLVPGKYKIELK